MKANTLRSVFLDFFQSKQHTIVSSAPMVIKDDPTLMFTNAGMNQFKDIFLGYSVAKDKRVVNAQKCLRVSGKHNDLEEVGHDTYHHTMFEMLGTWSFGDYFKKEAIDWAWEFLTTVCKLDKERIYVTIFEGSKEDGLGNDNEAFDIWKNHLPEERILNGNKKDNFWEMGETGPCGPCSEIHFDNRTDAERLKMDGKLLVNTGHSQVIEIWNLVFMQFNRFSDGGLKPLPHKHIDTGMGFERLCMIMQGVQSNYDTDIFQPIIKAIEKKTGLVYGKNDKQDIAMRVISDHLRAIAFSIADGQLPSNVKGGYVIRRILRRAVRYAYTFLDIKDAFIYDLVTVLVKQMGNQYTELKDQTILIQRVIKEEEESFLRTLEEGLKRIEHISKNNSTKMVAGKQIFELYDTYGFPADLTALILSEKGLSFNQEEFEQEMQKQKDRSKQAGKLVTSDWVVLIEDESEEFVGYNFLQATVKITKYRKVIYKNEQQYQLVFNITPFYPEGGGQLGDIGTLEDSLESIAVVDTKKENKLIVHVVKQLPTNLKAEFVAKVDEENRKACERNHTATHLLHESLQNILGSHVTQKGSLVCADYLRFDFAHFSKVDINDLQKIESEVNEKILANISLQEHTNIPLNQAKSYGAMMLFGEKYEDTVRMIQFDSSRELCGGTHVNATGSIGLFKILSEGSVSAGIRRIEAITGKAAFRYLNEKDKQFSEISDILKSKEVKKQVQQLIAANKQLEKQIREIKQTNIGDVQKDLLQSVVVFNGIRVIAQIVEMKADEMKNIAFALRKEENLAMVLASHAEEKALLTVMLTDDLVAKGMHAVTIIRTIATEIQGGGGGQAFFATAGGTDVSGINNALKKFTQLI